MSTPQKEKIKENMLIFVCFCDKIKMKFHPERKNDIMKAVLKILKILGVFFACLLAISVIWYLIEYGRSPEGEVNSVIDYVLYLIGYGDLQLKDHYSLTLFSIISLFTLTLMSSVFTVNLFELRSKARLRPLIEISEAKCGYEAHASIRTIGKDIYDVTAVLIAKIGDDLYSENIYLPFIPKKNTQKIKLSFDVGSPLYRYMRATLEGKREVTPLIITLTYTDIESGQEYKSCAKFTYSREGGDFGYSHKELLAELIDGYIMRESFAIDLSKAIAINDSDIDLSIEKSNGMSKITDVMRADVHMNSQSSYEPDSFVMACLNDFGENDWRKYADLGCHLDFDYQINGNMTVTLELKYGSNLKVYRQSLYPDEAHGHFSLDLNSDSVSYDDLSNVREICFTVFYKEMKNETHKGEFIINNCTLRIPPKA